MVTKMPDAYPQAARGVINAGMFSKADLELLSAALYRETQRSVTPAYKDSLRKLAERFDALGGMLS